MRVRIRHEVTHKVEPGHRTTTASIRVTPRNHEGQHILRWSLDVLPDCRLYPDEDAFGNLSHTFSVDGPAEAIIVTAIGEVDTQDTNGIVRGTVERFPPSLFLRQTDLTHAAPEVIAFAEGLRDKAADDLGRLHILMNTLHETVEEAAKAGDEPVASAADTLAAKSGTHGEITHLFTAVARHLGIPARHVSGYLAAEGGTGQFRSWAEAHVDRIGWIGFDSGQCLCPTDAYVRLSVALDADGVRVLRAAGSTTQMSVSADMSEDGWRGQGQFQGQD